MKTYAKLDNDKVEYMPYPTHISNPTAELLAAYAAENGYKELRYVTTPSRYHVRRYELIDDYITELWTAPSLEELKALKKAEAEAVKDAALLAPATIEVEGVGSVLYDERAERNVSCLVVLGEAGEQAYILADDSVAMLSFEQFKLIALAFKAHVNAIYAAKIADFAAIDAATEVDSLIQLD